MTRQEREREQLRTMIIRDSVLKYGVRWELGIEYELWAEGGLWHVMAAAVDGWPIRTPSFHPLDLEIKWVEIPTFERMVRLRNGEEPR